MDFITAVYYAEIGYRIRRETWSEGRYLDIDNSLDGYCWMDNVLSNDWKIDHQYLDDSGAYPIYND